GRDVTVRAVDANFLPLLGVTMAAGRPFETAEGRPEAGRAVCIIADDLWRREFDRRPLDDLTLTLGGRTCAVIGVTGPRFLGLELDPTDVWLPFGAPGLGTIDENGAPMPWHRSGVGRVQVLLRLPEDIARQSVIERLTAALAATDLAAGRASRTASLARVGDLPDTQPLRALRQLGVVGAIVFAIACANAMHLLLARGLRRQREIATRLALGASRARVVRLLIAEAATLAACGGAVAAVVGGSTADGLQGMLFPDARWTTAWLDGPTLIFNALATVAAGVITGATTGWLLTGSDLVGVFRSGRGLSTWRARRMRAGLLAAQTALSLALLAAAGLLGRSLIRLQAAPLGFDPEGLVSVVAGPVDGDPRQTDGTAGVLAARLRRERGVHKVALTSVPPFGAVKMAGVSVPGSPFAPEKPRDWPLVMAVSPEFFEVTRTPFLEGRTFGAGELDQPAVIVNASMAHAYWGGTPPPGACVSRDGLPCAPVIGVVADVIEMPAMSAPLRFYVPLGIGWDGPRVVVARADPAALSALPARVSSAFPILNRRGVDVASDRLTLTLRPWRTSARLFAAVAGVALLLVCIGIYGVISCGVSERMVEISLRVAFGATPSAVRRLVVGEGLKLIAAGAVVGLGAAALVGRHLESLLFSVSPYDPWVYGLALVAMIAAALGAMLPASIRASRLDAIVALRRE
ncbi:MAG TPA: ABC transporter permease, partial [Vicinamibacterales bacterium]|nr:ABC transporter permease [Vicinamibacterales bacterium]